MKNVNTQMTHRQKQALATQQIIVGAASGLFLEQGYPITTIEAIAERAGVAVSTVYAVFGSKRGILKAIREAWHQESGQREIFQDALAEPDPRRRLELAAHATRRQWEASGTMIRIYRSAAATEREAAAELAEALNGRRTFQRRFIKETAGMLRLGLAAERAAAIFGALTLAEVYEKLVIDEGWTADEYEAWLAEALRRELLGDNSEG
jgi:AcrR family transcriptional regulator